MKISKLTFLISQTNLVKNIEDWSMTVCMAHQYLEKGYIETDDFIYVIGILKRMQPNLITQKHYV